MLLWTLQNRIHLALPKYLCYNIIMTKKQTLKFTIRQDGHVTEEVIGAASGECLELTEQIDNKLGVLETRQFKPEFYQPAIVNEHVSLQHNKDQD